MPISSSGPISFADLQNEFGGSNPISMAEYFLTEDGFGGSTSEVTGRGYFCAGNGGSEIDGLKFSDETAINPAATIPTARNIYNSSVQSSTRGYLAGGIQSTVYQTAIDGIQFSDETAITTSAVLKAGRAYAAGVQSTFKGYFGGGSNTTVTLLNEIESFTFSTQTSADPAVALTVARWYPAGVSSQVRGYFAGGDTGSVSQEIDGIIFATEASTNPTAILGIGRRGAAGVNSAYLGFFGGGTYSGLNTNYIDGMLFANESHIHGLSATLATGRNEPASCESCVRGYWGGGWTGSSSSEIDGIIFATQAATNPAATLAVARTVAAGVNSPSVQNSIPRGRGYFSPGDNLSTVANVVEGFDFANETTFISSATMSSVRQLSGGIYSDVKGYWCGGITVTSEIDGIQFSNESSINPSAALSVARYWLAGVSSPTRGYLAGGTSTSPTPTDWLSEIDGLQFSDETAINPAATLSAGRYGPSGFNSITKGYWAAGINSSSVNVTTIDGFLFSTEAQSSAGNLLSSARAAGSVSGPLMGYVGGGNGNLGTDINSFDFRDESVNYVSTTLRQQRERIASINNSFVGIFAGGLSTTGGTFVHSVIDGINFDNQSTYSTLASLSDSKMNMTGVSAKAKTSTTNRFISVSNFRSFNSYRGYLGGGGIGQGNKIDGIKFIDDTSYVLTATLSSGGIGTLARSAVSSSSKGYWCGGGGFLNWIEPIRFIDETYVGVVASLTNARELAAGVSSSNRGYVGGGYSGGMGLPRNPYFNMIDGIQFSDDTSFITNATLSVARLGVAGTNSLTKGYFAGGYTGTSDTTEIDGIQFSDETAMNPAATLNAARRRLYGASSQTRGYYAGGTNLATLFTSIDGIQFSNESAFNLSATLATGRYALGAVSSVAKAYWAGGTAVTSVTEIDGIQFSDETAINPSATLSANTDGPSGTQSSPPRVYPFHGIENNLSMRRGYLGGGQGGSGNEIDGIQFSDETAINPSVTLSVARSTTMGIGSSSRGYWAGGVQVVNSTTPYRIIDGILLSDESSIVIGSSLATARFGGGAVGTSIKGYWAGGQTTASTSSQTNEIDAMIYATETSSNPSMTLPVSRHGISSTYSLTRGYFYGGFAGVDSSEIDGIQFSDETAINPTAVLAETRKWSAGVTNVNNGYLGGGFINGNADASSIIKFAYSTETRTNLGITLSVARRSLGAVNSSLRGYWAAGTGNIPADIDGIQFSDETAINPAATLSNPRDTLSGLQSYSFMLTGGSTLTDPSIVSASMYRGYFAGGATSSSAETNEIDGFQFSNESAVNPIATLSVTRQALTGINSQRRGYFAGGYQVVTYYSEIDGLQFSDETAINPAATLSGIRISMAGFNSSLYGFIAGGEDDGTIGYLSVIQGFRFSDETTFTPYNSSSLGTSKSQMATVDATLASTTNFSYIAGGLTAGGTISTIQKYHYYDELISTVSASLSVARRGLAGVSSPVNNPGKGYFCGGFSSTTWQNEIDGINYATDAAVNPLAALSVARTNLAGVNSSTRGYFAGGNASTGVTNEIDGLQYSDETAINPSATLSVARSDLAGVQSGAR